MLSYDERVGEERDRELAKSGRYTLGVTVKSQISLPMAERPAFLSSASRPLPWLSPYKHRFLHLATAKRSFVCFSY
tara:strand:+ start:1240 stop:1467 length:228 start_codon:yes stop_codon:yes gene_type:complete